MDKKKEKKKEYADYPSSARHVNFRMPTEIVDKMIALGMIPEEFDRKILSNAILEYFKNLTENVPSIEPKQAVDILDLLNAMNKKLDELRGKQPPQIA